MYRQQLSQQVRIQIMAKNQRGQKESKSHHVATPADNDGLWLYNVPRELIDPRDPVIQMLLLVRNNKQYSRDYNNIKQIKIRTRPQCLDYFRRIWILSV